MVYVGKTKSILAGSILKYQMEINVLSSYQKYK